MSLVALRRLALVGLVLLLASVSTSAQYGQRRFQMAYNPQIQKVDYNGQFTFARLKYNCTDPSCYYYMGEPAWAHGYQTSEYNLMQIVSAVTDVNPRIDETKVVAVDDPEIFKYPVVYMTEAGFWNLNDTEAADFRAYLLKGGFAIFDDFRDPGRFPVGGGWVNFESNMARVLPGLKIVDMDISDPIFHCFFDINTFNIIPQYYDSGRPEIRGIYLDNDHKKRLLAIINFNTDVSQFWEFSQTGTAPVDQSNEAYELGVNYIIYALTH